MTLPNGAAGVDNGALPYMVSANATSDTSVADLAGHDQPTVIAKYKAKYITGGNSVFSNPTGPLARVFGGLAGGIPALVLSLLGKIVSAVGNVESNIADAWAQIQKMGGLIVQVIQQLDETPLLAPADLLGAVWFWVGGLWNTVLQGNSKQNPAVVAHENRIAAAEAALAALGQPSRVDDFNDPTLAKWVPIGAHPEIVAPNGYVAKSAAFRAGEFIASNPATGKYKAQAAVVDLGYGRSRLIVQSNSAFTNMVVVELRRDNFFTTINLGSASSPDGTLAVQDSHTVPTGGFKYADVIGILVDESVNTFTALWNNTSVATWVDSAADIGTGATHRHLALCTNILSNPTFPGCGWEVFSQADIT